MHICFYEYREEETLLKKQFKNHTVSYYTEPLTLKNVKTAYNADIIACFLDSKLTKDLLQNLPNLKCITTRSTGFDHIDIAYCKQRNIIVTNVPFYGGNTVAEHTFALILALSRNIIPAYLHTQKNNFAIAGLKGFDIYGKTLGIIGTGHIGLHVIRYAKAFGMRVLAFDKHPRKALAKKEGFVYVSQEKLFSEADILTLHAPYTKETHHMLNKKAFSRMKPTALVINTSRGALIDTDALLTALQQKRIAGAGLDVLEGEEYLKEEKKLLTALHKRALIDQVQEDHALIRDPRVIFTPHIAFYSQEAVDRITSTTLENIRGFLHKKVPKENRVC